MNIYVRTQDYDLFKYLSNEQTCSLLNKSDEGTYATAALLFKAGDHCQNFFIVKEGELKITSEAGEIMGEVYQGEVIGEQFFSSSDISTISVSTSRPSEIITVPFGVITKFMEESAENASRIEAAINDTLCQKIIRITHYKDHNE